MPTPNNKTRAKRTNQKKFKFALNEAKEMLKYVIEFDKKHSKCGADLLCLPNKWMFEGLLSTFANITESLKIGYLGDKDTKFLFRVLLDDILKNIRKNDKLPIKQHFIGEFFSFLLFIVECNPFFTWNIIFIWKKHYVSYWNGDMSKDKCYIQYYYFFGEIIKRYVLDDYNPRDDKQFKKYMRSVKRYFNCNQLQFQKCCATGFSQSCNVIEEYFGISYKYYFSCVDMNEWLPKLIKIKNFADFLSKKSFKWLRNKKNKYILWDLYQKTQK